MEPKPKERIVFDEDPYYGDEGEKMAINDFMERDELTARKACARTSPTMRFSIIRWR